MYKHILSLIPHFSGIRLHENYFIVDLTLPKGWAYSEVYGDNIATRINHTNDNGSISLSLFSIFEEKTVENIIGVARLIIKDNQEKEEKERLLEVKKMELERLFVESRLEDLQGMSFIKNNTHNKPLLNEREKSQITRLVQEGSEERPEGNSNTKK